MQQQHGGSYAARIAGVEPPVRRAWYASDFQNAPFPPPAAANDPRTALLQQSHAMAALLEHNERTLPTGRYHGLAPAAVPAFPVANAFETSRAARGVPAAGAGAAAAAAVVAARTYLLNTELPQLFDTYVQAGIQTEDEARDELTEIRAAVLAGKLVRKAPNELFQGQYVRWLFYIRAPDDDERIAQWHTRAENGLRVRLRLAVGEAAPPHPAGGPGPLAAPPAVTVTTVTRGALSQGGGGGKGEEAREEASRGVGGAAHHSVRRQKRTLSTVSGGADRSQRKGSAQRARQPQEEEETESSEDDEDVPRPPEETWTKEDKELPGAPALEKDPAGRAEFYRARLLSQRTKRTVFLIAQFYEARRRVADPARRAALTLPLHLVPFRWDRIPTPYLGPDEPPTSVDFWVREGGQYIRMHINVALNALADAEQQVVGILAQPDPDLEVVRVVLRRAIEFEQIAERVYAATRARADQGISRLFIEADRLRALQTEFRAWNARIHTRIRTRRDARLVAARNVLLAGDGVTVEEGERFLALLTDAHDLQTIITERGLTPPAGEDGATAAAAAYDALIHHVDLAHVHVTATDAVLTGADQNAARNRLVRWLRLMEDLQTFEGAGDGRLRVSPLRRFLETLVRRIFDDLPERLLRGARHRETLNNQFHNFYSRNVLPRRAQPVQDSLLGLGPPLVDATPLPIGTRRTRTTRPTATPTSTLPTATTTTTTTPTATRPTTTPTSTLPTTTPTSTLPTSTPTATLPTAPFNPFEHSTATEWPSDEEEEEEDEEDTERQNSHDERRPFAAELLHFVEQRNDLRARVRELEAALEAQRAAAHARHMHLQQQLESGNAEARALRRNMDRDNQRATHQRDALRATVDDLETRLATAERSLRNQGAQFTRQMRNRLAERDREAEQERAELEQLRAANNQLRQQLHPNTRQRLPNNRRVMLRTGGVIVAMWVGDAPPHPAGAAPPPPRTFVKIKFICGEPGGNRAGTLRGPRSCVLDTTNVMLFERTPTMYLNIEAAVQAAPPPIAN